MAEKTSGTCRTVLFRWPSALGMTEQAHRSKSRLRVGARSQPTSRTCTCERSGVPQFHDLARSLPVPSGIGALRVAVLDAATSFLTTSMAAMSQVIVPSPKR